jgi:hypothetical protein
MERIPPCPSWMLTKEFVSCCFEQTEVGNTGIGYCDRYRFELYRYKELEGTMFLFKKGTRKCLGISQVRKGD